MSTAPGYNFALYDQQHDFVACDSRFSAFIGGVASGKTIAGAIKSLIAMLEHPDWERGIIIAPTYQMLLDATYQTCIDVWGDLILTKTTAPYPSITLVTGQVALFRSADDPERLRGPNLYWAWVDEGAYCHKNTWTRLIARLRAGGLAGPAWITTTPNQLNWVHDLLAGGRITLFHAQTQDNPYLAQEFIDDLVAMYPGDLARQELGGEFIRFGAGLIRSDWFPHISRDYLPPDLTWHRYWDLATSVKTSSDYTASIRCAHNGTAAYLSRPIIGRWIWPAARRTIIQTARSEFGSTVALGVESNAFQLAAVQDLTSDPIAKQVGIFPIQSATDKLARALPWIGQASMGNVILVDEPSVSWSAWLESLESFPEGAHDDPVDATSGAYLLRDKLPHVPRARVRGGRRAA